MSEMKDRLKDFMNSIGINSKTLAGEIGVQPSSVSHILTGRNEAGVEFLRKLIRRYPETDIYYLLTGENQSRYFKPLLNEDLQNDLKENKAESDLLDSVSTQSEHIVKKALKIVEFFNDGTFREYLPS